MHSVKDLKNFLLYTKRDIHIPQKYVITTFNILEHAKLKSILFDIHTSL